MSSADGCMASMTPLNHCSFQFRDKARSTGIGPVDLQLALILDVRGDSLFDIIQELSVLLEIMIEHVSVIDKPFFDIV